MRFAVSGSIADDYLLTFPGKFADMILADQIERLSLSFLADTLDHRRGGIGCNIAFGMGQLGAKPLLIGAAGQDFTAGYQQWLERHDVDCSGVYLSQDKGTARFLCTTDAAQSQIATFYAGAMADARLIELAPLVEAHGPFDGIVVCPDDPEGMLRRTREAHGLGLDVVADPSQQLARIEGPQIRLLIEGARYLICNDYERGLILSKTGWSGEELAAQVQVLVTTHGPDGAQVEEPGQPVIRVDAVPPLPSAALEPTGAGDAFRAGFLSALSVGLRHEAAAQLGCMIATLALETVGPQDYQVKANVLAERLADSYGADASAHIMSALPLD